MSCIINLYEYFSKFGFYKIRLLYSFRELPIYNAQ